MSHFYGGVRGNSGLANRLGTARSGISAFAQGWNIGGKVKCYYDRKLKRDIVVFTITMGSGESPTKGVPEKLLGSVCLRDDGEPHFFLWCLPKEEDL